MNGGADGVVALPVPLLPPEPLVVGVSGAGVVVTGVPPVDSAGAP